MLYTNNKKTIFVDNKQHINYNMKKFIRWLSDISGVTREIEVEQTKLIGRRLINESRWFNGGITYKNPISSIINFAFLYGESLQGGSYPDISSLRDTIYKMKEQGLSVYKDREVCGYWRDTKSPYFLTKEEYNNEVGYEPQLRIKWKDKI